MATVTLIPSDDPKLDADARRLKLNNQDRVFCETYIASNFDYKKAIKAAGYNKFIQKLQSPRIQAYLSILMKRELDKLGVDKESVIRVLSDIAFFDATSLYCEITGDVLPLAELSPQARNAIKEVLTTSMRDPETGKRKTVLKGYILHDKSKALEMLAKHLGLFEKDNMQSRTLVNQQHTIIWN